MKKISLILILSLLLIGCSSNTTQETETNTNESNEETIADTNSKEETNAEETNSDINTEETSTEEVISNETVEETNGEDNMESTKILFINASQNRDGNTANMAKDLLEGIDYKQINIIDYNIGFLGQEIENDQFSDFISEIEQAETIIIGTPVYWHSMSGALKTAIDRFNPYINDGNTLEVKDLYFFMQGSAPTDLSIESTEYIIQRLAYQTKINLVAMADNAEEISELHNQLIKKYQ